MAALPAQPTAAAAATPTTIEATTWPGSPTDPDPNPAPAAAPDARRLRRALSSLDSIDLLQVLQERAFTFQLCLPLFAAYRKPLLLPSLLSSGLV